ncbi:hypothetical protein BKI52_30825 [marine bacterium AO1-C]|nr:hypothetical protein BKI52_30825 [marine bacterium AO1-C]
MAKVIDKTGFESEVKPILDAWVNTVGDKLDTDLTQYFKLPGDKGIGSGFSVSFKDFKQLINTVGTQFFKARFGIQEDKFALVLWGVGNAQNGTLTQVSTNYLILDHQDFTFDNKTIPNLPEMRNSVAKLPIILAHSRLESWRKLTTLKSGIFKINLINENTLKLKETKTLRGYNYSLIDFFGIFIGIESFPEEDITIRIDFCYLNYDSNSMVDPTQGFFDLLFSTVVSNGTAGKKIQNAFYDAGAPCPPLCNGGGGGD